MKKKLLFVFNPKSGKGLIKEHLVNIVDIMTKAGYKITIYPTQCQGDAIKKVRKNAKKYDLVVCSGGDGTLDEVVTGMEQSEVNVPIGYIPAGSTNDFANSLGIPKNMEEAARVAVNGTPFPCDVGGFKGISGPDVLLDDGLFEVTLIKNPKNPIELNKILAGLANRENDNELIYSFKTRELHVESEEEVPWTLDGEFGGSHTDLTITNLNKQITIMC